MEFFPKYRFKPGRSELQAEKQAASGGIFEDTGPVQASAQKRKRTADRVLSGRGGQKMERPVV